MVEIDTKRTYQNVLVGAYIRRQIGKASIFRIRRGNGHYGAKLGEVYQDKYDYFVPTSITNVEGEASRTCFAAAVAAWQNLSEDEKKLYITLAGHIQFLSGYNLFIRRYMQKNYT